MNKVALYLQEHVLGEVMANPEIRRYFSTDASVFSVMPSVVLYPRNENDIRKTARFCWQLAERGRVIPITSRGSGTDFGGAAIGSGIVMVFPAHLNRILELDSKSGAVSVEPGINFGKLQEALHTHGRYVPPYPASLEYSTVGGAIANNAAGEKSIKYGSMGQYVHSLKVVLANGEVIRTGRISKREVNKKLGLATFEGEIYRSLDKLFEEHRDIIQENPIKVPRNTAGFNIWDVRKKDGSMDLTPLFIGSQGTLGIITQAELSTEPYNPQTTLVVAYCDDLKTAGEIVHDLNKLPDSPSAVEMVDENLLNFVESQNPNLLEDLLHKPFPKLVLLIEFDELNDRQQKRMVKKTQKILQKYEVSCDVERDIKRQAELWKIRHSASLLFAHVEGNTKAIPVIEDGIVPVERFEEYLKSVYEIFTRNHLNVAVWGHAGSGSLRLQPLLDLSQVGDRQRAFRVMDEYYKMVISLGGSTSGEDNDGRLRAPYLPELYGQDIYGVFEKVKAIFDPYGTLNPGVKVGVTSESVRPLLRNEYSLSSLANHLPRS